MSFKVNSSQQISFNDSVFSLTAREKKALDNSWAKIFADEIFPNIDEERFSVLYSSKASRPNAPVNVIIGALIIKELFDYSDDEIVENLMLDLHLQYALHTTSFEEQPISDKTLSRFRSRCYNYETTHGIDLYHDCVKDLSSKIAKLMNLSGRIKRMDSMMIESNIRFLSRMELIYTCSNRQISRRIKKHLWLSNRSWARDVHSFGILHSWGALAGKSCSAQASSIWLIAGAFRRTQSK